MKNLNDLGRTKSAYRDNWAFPVVFSLLSVLAAIIPAGQIGYILPGVVCLLLALLLIGNFRIAIGLAEVIVLIGAILLAVLNTAVTGEGRFWDYRDFFRLIFLVPLFAIVRDYDKEKIQKVMAAVIFLTLSFDFLFLFNNIIPVISNTWYDLAVNYQFKEYIEGYYRHLGVMGSPNLSAGLYFICIYSLLFLLKAPRTLVFGGATLAFALLFASQSRSQMLAVLIAFGIAYRGFRAIFIQSLIGLFSIYYLVDYYSTSEIFLERIDEFSSFEDRLAISEELFANSSYSDLLFGSPNLPSIIDNDITLYFLRFGIVLFSILLFAIYKRIAALYRIGGREVLGFATGIAVSSLAGGVLGHPGLIMFASVLLAISYKPSGVMHSSNS